MIVNCHYSNFHQKSKKYKKYILIKILTRTGKCNKYDLSQKITESKVKTRKEFL